MLINVDGDLLQSDCDVIMHQSNCLGAFGGGIAGQIRNKLPGAYIAFISDMRLPTEKFGNFSITNFRIGNFKYIFNLYGQYDFGGEPGVIYTDYEKLYCALEKAIAYLKMIPNSEKFKIGVPYKMGSGLAGGNWETVSYILNMVSIDHEIDIYAYNIENL